MPNPAFLEIAPFLPDDYAGLLRKVQYQWASALVLTLKQSLSPIYWLNISDPEIPFVGAIEHTNYIEPAQYGGLNILYLSNYVEDSSPVVGMSIDEISDYYLPHLTKINPAFSRDWIVDRWLFKDAAGQPVITTQLRRLDSLARDACARPLPGEHDADLPGGPRPQLLRPPRRQDRVAGDCVTRLTDVE